MLYFYTMLCLNRIIYDFWKILKQKFGHCCIISISCRQNGLKKHRLEQQLLGFAFDYFLAGNQNKKISNFRLNRKIAAQWTKKQMILPSKIKQTIPLYHIKNCLSPLEIGSFHNYKRAQIILLTSIKYFIILVVTI